MQSDINISRDEKRFLLLRGSLDNFLHEVNKVLKERNYSENNINRTIYFNDDENTIPWGVSLKARRFLKDFSGSLSIDPLETYRFEFKSSGNGIRRQKKLNSGSLSQASLFFEKCLKRNRPRIQIAPIGMTEYRRRHFTGDHPELLRLTIDQDMVFGYFNDSPKPAIQLSGEDFIRVELKTASSSNEEKRINDIVSEFFSLPIISKREHLFNQVALEKKREGKTIIKDLLECEIEAKFLVNHIDPAWFLFKLKEFFRNSNGKYWLPKHYPFTTQTASINHYWKCEDGNELKLLFRGDRFSNVLKRNTVLHHSPLSRAIIMERFESKEKGKTICSISDFSNFLDDARTKHGKLTSTSHVDRSRRAFWIDNKETGRTFHISLDKCLAQDGKVLWELEIEYVGIYADHHKEFKEKMKSIIVNELFEISNMVLSFCDGYGSYIIEPTAITKFNWSLSD